MSLQRYETYKDSGIPWLGDIPAHWGIKRLKKLVQGSLVNGLFKKKEAYGSGVLLINVFDIYRDNFLVEPTTLDRVQIDDKEAKPYKVESGDMFFVRSSLKLEGVGRSACALQISEPMVFECHLVRGRPKKKILFPIYANYFLNSPVLNSKLVSKANVVTMATIDQGKIQNLEFLLPPLLEQCSIAAYLDERTAKLDRLITNKREQIRQLETLRKVTIHDAVTKGLNPDAPMKDSGIPWLGEVPAHWQIKRLSKIATLLQTGPFGSQLHSEEYIENGIPVINPSHLIGGQVVPDPKVSVDSDVFDRLTRHAFKVGDIVFARRGEMGRCALVTEESVGWLCGTGSLLFRAEKRKVVSEYISTVLASRGIKDTLELMSVGSTMDNLNTDILGSIKVPLPPVDEQHRIDMDVKKKLVCIDQLRSNFTKQISHLETLRNVTIHDAVTGKVKVPGVEV